MGEFETIMKQFMEVANACRTKKQQAKSDSQKLFHQIDSNKDGKLDLEELEEAMASGVITRASGAVSEVEFQRILEKIADKLAEAGVPKESKAVKMLSKDKNSCSSFVLHLRTTYIPTQ